MSIFDIETPQQITRDDLLRDNWSPDRLGRTWTKRLKVINPSESFIGYLYIKYTIRDPHTKKRYELEVTDQGVSVFLPKSEHIFKNIRTLQDIHLIIHSIARKICDNYRIEEYPINTSRGYETWQEYFKDHTIDHTLKSKLDVIFKAL